MEARLEEDFWRLCVAGLWGDGKYLASFHKLSDGDWNEIAKAAKRQGVEGLLAEGIQFLPSDLMPPSGLKQKITQTAIRLVLGHSAANKDISYIFELLKAYGFKPVLLKGEGNTRFFKNPVSRSGGDIDIYIGSHDFDQCMARLIGDGIVKYEDILYDGKHAEFRFQNSSIEIHRFSALFFDEGLRDKFNEIAHNELTANSELLTLGNAYTVDVPGPIFNLFFLFYHLLVHFVSEGPRIKQFFDWTAAFAYYQENKLIDNRLLSLLQNLQLLKEWQKMGCFVVRYCGLDRNLFPYYEDKYEREADDIYAILCKECLNAEYVRKMARRPSGFVSGKLFSFWHQTRQHMRLVPLFPRLALMRYWWMTQRGLKMVLHGKQMAYKPLPRVTKGTGYFVTPLNH